jgi:hypothetical protein
MQLIEICKQVIQDPVRRSWQLPTEQFIHATLDFLTYVSASEGHLSRIAEISYIHPLGYRKIVLWQSARRERIRLHLWPSSVNNIVQPDVHDHYWDFRSFILSGALRFRHFDVSRRGARYKRYSMSPVGNGAYDLMYCGTETLMQTSEIVASAGSEVALACSALHSTTALCASATLVCQSRRAQNTNTVYQPAKHARNETHQTPQRMTAPDLRNAFEELGRLLGG